MNNSDLIVKILFFKITGIRFQPIMHEMFGNDIFSSGLSDTLGVTNILRFSS